MLRKKSSFTSQQSSPSPSPIPGSRSSSSAGNHYPQQQQQHDCANGGGVRRAFSSLQHALSPSRGPSFSSERKAASTSEHFDHTSIDSSAQKPLNSSVLTGSTFSANSHTTTDSFYVTASNLTSLTTDDESASSTHSRGLHRPRPLSKASSGPSPLSSSYQNDSTHFVHHSHQHLGSESLHTSGTNGFVTSGEAAVATQLRVRHLELGASYSGYLTKFSSRTFFSRKQWKRRYFVLNERSLHCFKSSDPQHPLLESMVLCADTIICVTDIFSGKRYCLQITSPGEKNWYVLADTASEMSGWLRELKGTVLRFRSPQPDSRPGTHYSDSSELSELSASSAMMNDVSSPVPMASSSYDLFLTASRSPSPPPPRPLQPPVHLDLYHVSSTGKISTPQESDKGSKNASVSSGEAADYASFGTVMERADAISPEEQKATPFPLLPPASTPRYQWNTALTDHPDDNGGGTTAATNLNGALTNKNNSSGRNSTMSVNRNGSSSSNSSGSTNGGRRLSIVVDRPEKMITLPRRNSQRLTGSPSRPMSPVSSRPAGPNVNRASPRSSLVVSPPPRSIHRPSSSLSRHSSQGLHSLSRSTSPALEMSLEGYHGSLSRLTSIRQLRENTIPAALSGHQRSFSRTGILNDRPLSPTPSLSAAPTSPLPEPPSGQAGAPNHTLKHSFSNGSSHRISIVPRHHDPDLFIPLRSSSKSRSRTTSQDGTPVSMVGGSHATPRSSTPSPRLSATISYSEATGSETGQGFIVTPPLSPLGPSALPEGMLKRLPLDSQGRLVLPAPPTGQQPEPPISASTSVASVATMLNSSPRTSNRASSTHRNMHRHTPSTSSVCSVSSTTSSIASYATSAANAPVVGGGVVRKHSNRDAALAARLSTLAPIPLGAAASVPLPPQTALPPIPIVTPPSSGSHPRSRPSSVQSMRAPEEPILPEALSAHTTDEAGPKQIPVVFQAGSKHHDVVSVVGHVDGLEATTTNVEPIIVGFEMILEEEEETECESVIEDGEHETSSLEASIRKLEVSDEATASIRERDASPDLEADSIILLSNQSRVANIDIKFSAIGLSAPSLLSSESSALA
ncbi:Pleckstrin y domain-containing A member 2 [Mortierella alpina]|nr:Pleckstrin y domain-containing A member 2 [Mortierella alpina]